MATHTSKRKPDRLTFIWIETLFDAAMQLWMIFLGRGTVLTILCLFWDLTAVLWAPQNWLHWLQWIVMASGGTYINIDSLIDDPRGPCLSLAEKKTAVEADAAVVSGWYGPGAYLAWLFTAYVSALSSIWNADYTEAKRSAQKPAKHDGGPIDGEFLAALTYPAVAILDIAYRFIRCNVDPTLDAAMLVVLTGVFALGTARRLADPPDVDRWADGDFLPAGPRQWTLTVFLCLGHSLVWETMREPFGKWRLAVTVYALVFANLLHSCVKVERLMDRYPYRVYEKRPRVERIVVFVVLQVVFLVVVGVTQGSVFPRTGASLVDLDQCATLVTVVVGTVFARRTKVLDWVGRVRLRRAGFHRVQGDPLAV